MTSDPFQAYKETQRDNWKSFAPLAMTTTPSAAKLVRFAGVRPNQRVLDVGCGTGVVAITARRAGGIVTGFDLTPELLAVARRTQRSPDWDTSPGKRGKGRTCPFRTPGLAACWTRSPTSSLHGPESPSREWLPF